MASIKDWLHANNADFRDQAKVLVNKAEAEGFTVAEIKEACGGDVERYLLDQQNAMTDANRQQTLADDA